VTLVGIVMLPAPEGAKVLVQSVLLTICQVPSRQVTAACAEVAPKNAEPKAKARAATDALNRLKNEPPRFANSTSTLKRARQSRPTLKSKK
jgi:hypothetical protein